MQRRRFLSSLAVGVGAFTGCTSNPSGRGTDSDIANGIDVADRAEATVTDIVDGDTLNVRYASGDTDSVRLLGVDTPEVHTEVSPDEFPGVPDTRTGRRWLSDWGNRASEFAEETVGGANVTLVIDDRSERRGSYDRLLAYVYAGERSLNRQLLAEGYATVYPSDFSLREAFERIERQARESNTGVWGFDSDEAEGVDIAAIHADAPGDDRQKLNEEYVVIKNHRPESVDLTGWQLADDAGHTYRFPNGYVIDSSDDVTIHTGSGDDGGGELYWGADAPVWNNDGDTGTLRDVSGEVVDKLSY